MKIKITIEKVNQLLKEYNISSNFIDSSIDFNSNNFDSLNTLFSFNNN